MSAPVMPARNVAAAAVPAEPPRDCGLCPRLVAFRRSNTTAHPDWFNGAVPSFGPDDARLLIVGLAPGLKGAKPDGPAVSGDFAGDLLYPTLLKSGLAHGEHDLTRPEALTLVDCMITNAVRCVPPQNKPTSGEIGGCRPFLAARIEALPQLQSLLAIGRIAHDSLLDTFALRKRAYPFGHGARHALPNGLTLFDTYHCSRLNTNTGRLTAEMFERVVGDAAASLGR